MPDIPVHAAGRHNDKTAELQNIHVHTGCELTKDGQMD